MESSEFVLNSVWSTAMPNAPPENSPKSRIDFGAFALDPRSGEIWRDGKVVRLAALPSRLLRYLAVNRSRTVSKAELAAELWAGLHVEESTLQQAVRAARKAVGDDGRRQQVIETVSGVGYRFIGVPVAEPPESARVDLAGPSYIGQRALVGLLGRFVEMRDSQPGLLLLSGDPGVGKSRAIEELSRLAWAQNLTVVRGGGNAPAGAPDYWPWIEAFRDLSGVRPVEVLRDRAPHLLGAGAKRVSAGGEPDRFRALAAALRCLEASARLGPLVVILEDLHESGSATLELLEFVLLRVESVPLLLVATYRELELRTTPACEATLARLLDHPRTSSKEIKPLSEVETAYLVEQRSGLEIPADEVSSVARFTGSNPFFAIELANHLAEEDRSPEQEARSSWIERNAGRALADRLARLDPDVRAVLEVASACGTTFDPAVVAKATGKETVHGELRIAIRERVIGEPASGSGHYGFSHTLVRDALYDELARRSREREATHLRVAEALVEIDRELEIQAAYHVCVAASLAGARRVTEAAERAVRRAAQAGDLETAATLYERALQAFERIRSPAPALRLRVLVAAGEFGVRSDHPSRELARARLDEAIDSLRGRENPELFARAALARTYRTEIVGIADGPTLELLAEAISKLEGSNPALTAQLRSRRAIESRYAAGGESDAYQAVELAIREARACNDPRALARVLEDASLVRWSVPDPEGWLRLNQEIVEAAEGAADAELLFQGVKGLATAYLELGDRDGYEREFERCAAIAEDYPSPFLKGVVHCFAGTLCFIDGDFQGAEQKAILAASSGLDAIAPLAAGQLFYHRRELGRLAELEGAVRQFIEDSPGIAMWPIALARALVDSGQSEDARRVLDEMKPVETIAKDRNWLPTLIVLAESAVILEDHPLCERVLAALEPHARVGVVLGNGSLFLGQTAHYLGSLALTLGRRQEAKTYLEQAAAMHARMRSEPWQLRTRSEQAHLVRAEGDAKRARTMAEQISERARAIGMIRCAERAEAAA